MRTQVWAHRGASYYAPENTMAAFERAAAMGADGIELDVQMTNDGEIVVIHDETINRTSNGKGYVKDYTLKELERFNFNAGFKMYRQQKIPTLKEVLEFISDTLLVINIELKNARVQYKGMEEKVVKLVNETGLGKRVIYSSFNYKSLFLIKEMNEVAQTGLLYSHKWQEAVDYAKEIGAYALHPQVKLLRKGNLVEKSREKGLALHVWTVDGKKEMSDLVIQGVEAIITNKPDICRRVIETKK